MTTQMQNGIRTLFATWFIPGLLAVGALSTTGMAASERGSPHRRPLPPIETPIPRVADAASIYDEVGERFRELDRALFEGLPVAADDPQAVFIASGIADPRMAQWLESARPLGDRLIEATALEYRRAIDPQDGFTLGPAYLAPLRTTNRSIPLLVHDAALRGDRERLARLLGVQITLAIRTAGDATLPSSISAISAVQQHMHAVDALLDRGLLDATTAARLIELRAPLEQLRDYGTQAATLAELDALKIELDRILWTPLEQRPAAVAGLRITVPVKLDDNAIIAARQGAEAYLSAVSAALGNADSAAGRHDIALAEQRLRDGAFGELLKVLAPQVLPTVDLLIQSRVALESQRDLLERLARGESSPASLADAGWYYMLSARAAMQIPHAAQSAIEEIRTSASPSAAMTAEARRAIDACREAVVAPLVLANEAARCSMPTHPVSVSGAGLVRSCSNGMHGAVRVMLADAFGGGARAAATPSREEAIVIGLRIAQRFSVLGSYSHSLVAHQILRDVLVPLAQLEKQGALTPDLRKRLGDILAEMPESDPLGFGTATESERLWLGSHTFASQGGAIVAFERGHLDTLQPNHIAFLLAILTDPSQAPHDAPRGSPIDGALVDIRSWFDLAAFKRAVAQSEAVRARAHRSAQQAPVGAQDRSLSDEAVTAITWLDVTVPLDVESRMREAMADHQAALRIVSTKTTVSRRRP